MVFEAGILLIGWLVGFFFKEKLILFKICCLNVDVDTKSVVVKYENANLW